MPDRDYPILSPPGTWAFVLEMVCRDSARALFTEDAAVYGRVRGGLDELLLAADRQWECCDAGKQWVAAIDSERIVVIQHVTCHDDGLGGENRTYEWAVEFYCTDDAYEDRLDQLATVAVVA